MDALIDELRDFCNTHHLPHESADELMCRLQEQPEPNRTDATQRQIEYLRDFVSRWDSMERGEGAQ